MGLNHFVGMGRLTADPELRKTQGGISVTSFKIAIERDVAGADGERGVDFVDVVAWRETAEFVSKYFEKGKVAVVKGRLQVREWTDKEENRRKSYEIVADRVYFGDTKRKGEGEASMPKMEEVDEADDGELPF